MKQENKMAMYVFFSSLLTAFPYGAFVLASRDHRHRFFSSFLSFSLPVSMSNRCREAKRKKNFDFFFSSLSLNVALDTSTKCRKEKKIREEKYMSIKMSVC